MQFAFNIFLHLLYQFIAMQFLRLEYNKCRLSLSVNFYLVYFRTQNRCFPIIIFFHQVYHQVKKRVGATVSVNTVFIRDEFIGLQIYIWVHASE
jgi:hypothetical protein